MRRIHIGGWRNDADGPMQVVSRPLGRQRVHCTAPPAKRLEQEISAFLAWFEDMRSIDPVLSAGMAHLRFVSIHPFQDGNGRIARAIADMALARSEESPERFYSMSAQIRLERNAATTSSEQPRTAGWTITARQLWFLGCLGHAIGNARRTLASVLAKADFWEAHASEMLNERQVKVLNRILDGFEGNLSSSRWARMSHCSQNTANRDIRDLVERGILIRGRAGARSTNGATATFTLPRLLRTARARKPATKARTMVSPRTGEEIQVSAKTASTAVKLRPLAGLTMHAGCPARRPARCRAGTTTARRPIV